MIEVVGSLVIHRMTAVLSVISLICGSENVGGFVAVATGKTLPAGALSLTAGGGVVAAMVSVTLKDSALRCACRDLADLTLHCILCR